MAVNYRKRSTNKEKNDFRNKKGKSFGFAHLKTVMGNPIKEESGMFYLPSVIAFKAVFCSRIVSAVWLHITDCDETFNYWEPSHYLLFDTGFQTWEYSPQYALRSYFYLLIHVVPAWIYNIIFQPNKILLFYFIRCMMAIICAAAEVYFYRSVCREFGINVGRIMLIILIFSPGMFIASTAFLPSSFSMYMTFLSMGAWFHRKYLLAIFFTALSALVSWPFAALIGLPIAYEMVFVQKHWHKFITWSTVSALLILLPLIEVDSSYYGKFTISPWNIVKYNIFSSHGPNLYGTEPWFFYLFNGILNFNISFLIAVITPFLLIWIKVVLPKKARHSDCFPYSLSLSAFFLWLFVFSCQPHKEERFLFPVYPLIALCGAVGIDAIQILWFRYFIKRGYHYTKCTMKIMITIIILYAALGISRMLVLYKAYRAPMDIFMELTKIDVKADLAEKSNINLCIGKQWYQFPNSYFLPNKWELRFIKSDFKGLLPAQYLNNVDATKIIRMDMNDLNKEEFSRYVNVDTCDFIIDLDSEFVSELEPLYSHHSNWTTLVSFPYLNTAKTSKILRSFYIPVLWEFKANFSSYHLLRRRK